MAEAAEMAKVLPGRAYSKDLIEILFRQPYTKVQFLVDAGIAERKTAADYSGNWKGSAFCRATVWDARSFA